MFRYLLKIREAVAIAARMAVVFAVSVFAFAVVRVVINGLLEGKWGFDWRKTAELAAIFGAIWFCVQFVYTFFRLCSAAPTEAILSSVPSGGDAKPALVGFVAMEYYSLIFNRTFVIFIAPEALYGWKASGNVTNMRSMYFQPYVQMLNDPALMHNPEAVQKLAALKGGFVIPRSQILGAELIPGTKWGMGGIPHTGRIRIRLSSGKMRELILLGNIDADRIQQEILSGVAAPEHSKRTIPLPYVARYQKKLWIPLLFFWVAIAGIFAAQLTTLWRDPNSTWGLRIASLLMMFVPILLVFEFLVQNTRFTDSEIQRRTRLGTVRRFSYSDVSKLSISRNRFLRIDFKDAEQVTLYRWQGDPTKILSILETKTGLTIVTE